MRQSIGRAITGMDSHLPPTENDSTLPRARAPDLPNPPGWLLAYWSRTNVYVLEHFESCQRR